MPQGPRPEVPVFVDESGNRLRTARRIGYTAAVVACAYAAVLVANLVSEEVAPDDEGPEFSTARVEAMPEAASPPWAEVLSAPTLEPRAAAAPAAAPVVRRIPVGPQRPPKAVRPPVAGPQPGPARPKPVVPGKPERGEHEESERNDD